MRHQTAIQDGVCMTLLSVAEDSQDRHSRAVERRRAAEYFGYKPVEGMSAGCQGSL